jgi:hypothetical protein
MHVGIDIGLETQKKEKQYCHSVTALLVTYFMEQSKLQIFALLLQVIESLLGMKAEFLVAFTEVNSTQYLKGQSRFFCMIANASSCPRGSFNRVWLLFLFDF